MGFTLETFFLFFDRGIYILIRVPHIPSLHRLLSSLFSGKRTTKLTLYLLFCSVLLFHFVGCLPQSLPTVTLFHKNRMSIVFLQSSYPFPDYAPQTHDKSSIKAVWSMHSATVGKTVHSRRRKEDKRCVLMEVQIWIKEFHIYRKASCSLILYHKRKTG